MKKYIIIMLLFATSAFASAAPAQESYIFMVENSTMVDAYYNIFNAIGALFKNNDYLDLLRLAFLIGGFFVFMSSVLTSFEGNGSARILSPYGKYLFIGMSLLTIVFSYRSIMVIQTNNIPSFCSSSSPTTGTAVELPSILAYTFKVTNQIGTGLTDLAESSYSLPHTGQGNASMSSSDGYLGALKQTIKVLSIDPNKMTMNNKSNMTNTDKHDFTQEWTKFFNSCVYQVANNKPNGADILEEMSTDKNLYEWSKKHLDYSYPSYSNTVGDNLIEFQGGRISCRDYFTKLDAASQALLDNFACTMPIANGGVLELLTGTNGTTTAATPALELSQIGRQAGLVNALRNVKDKNAIGIQGANSFSGGKARADSNVNNLSSASYMADMLPFVQMTMRAILYAFFPFVFVVVLLPGGLNVLKQYLQTMIWVELWSPTAAVVNMFVNLQVQATVGKEYSTNGLTMVSSIDMLSEANTIAGVGAMLYLSIPALTWLILKGSAMMIGSVMSGTAAKFSSGLESDKKGDGIAKDEQRRRINADRAAKGQKVLSHGEMVHFEQMAAGAGAAGTTLSQIENGINKEQDANRQKKSEELKTAEIQKVLSGSNENVGQIKAETAGNALVKNKAINDGTTIDDHKVSGDVQSKEMNAVKDTANQNGTQGFYDAKTQEVNTKLDTAAKKKAKAGSNTNVANVESQSNLNEFAKKKVVTEGTTTNQHENLAKKDIADIQGTSEVVSTEGTQGFKDSKIQTLTAESKTAKEKKAVSGSNGAAAQTMTDKNIAEHKTDKKTFDKYSTDTVSDSNFEKKKEDVTKTLENKRLVNESGLDTEDVYKNEARMSRKDADAHFDKADTNNDGIVDEKELDTYGADMSKKGISDQMSLKAKNEMLLQNADKYANSKNKEVRDIYNNAKANFASHGEDYAKIAASAAVQNAISTKEQRLTSNEKSEYVDRTEANNLDGTEKAKVQVQKDVEDIHKTESGIESYARFAKEQNEGTKNMKSTEAAFFDKFKENGLNDEDAVLKAKNATLKSYAKEAMANDEYTKDVLNHNVSDITNKMNHKLEAQAYKEGVITDDDLELVKEQDELQAEQAELESYRSEKGSLNPYHAGKLYNVNRKLNNVGEDLTEVREKVSNWSSKDSDAKAILSDATNKISNVKENMKNMKVIKENANGEISFANSTMDVDVDNMTEVEKGTMRAMKGRLEGKYIRTMNHNGHNIERSYNLANEVVTDFETSKKGYAMVSDFTYDKGYAFSEVTDGQYHKEQAIVNTGVKTLGAAGGMYKFLNMK